MDWILCKFVVVFLSLFSPSCVFVFVYIGKYRCLFLMQIIQDLIFKLYFYFHFHFVLIVILIKLICIFFFVFYYIKTNSLLLVNGFVLHFCSVFLVGILSLILFIVIILFYLLNMNVYVYIILIYLFFLFFCFSSYYICMYSYLLCLPLWLLVV